MKTTRLTHLFTPADNRRIANLCGPLDENLPILAQGCAVHIARRHEQFKIEGAKADTQRALTLLQAAYQNADRPLSPDDIQLMLRGEEDSALAEQEILGGSVRPRTRNQAAYLQNIAEHDITFATGPAGTGKTYLAVAAAIDALQRHQIQRIVLTRPLVEAGERLGFLPGDLIQKVDPYLRPLYDALYDLMGTEKTNKAFERGQIEIAPLAFMRGRTIPHAFIILDEAQNTTPEQMKMLLTRMGFASRAVITGDPTQIDLPAGHSSGLLHAQKILHDTPGIAHSHFDSQDVLRHPLVAEIIRTYDKNSLQ